MEANATRRALVSRLDLRTKLQNYGFITVGVLVLAVNLYLFLAPPNIAPGGVSGVAIIVNELKTGIPVSQIYLATDGIVVLTASLVFGWEMGLYALITLFVWGLATDFVLEGPSVVRTAFIVTDVS